jgi:hypothetical protein
MLYYSISQMVKKQKEEEGYPFTRTSNVMHVSDKRNCDASLLVDFRGVAPSSWQTMVAIELKDSASP